MSDNIVSLRGNITANEPVPNVVEKLEQFLEQAKNGDLRAFAIATVYRDGHITTGWEKPFSSSDIATTTENHGLGSGILTLSVRYGLAG